MLKFVDFRFDWENHIVVICMQYVLTGKHFYIHEAIDSEQEANEIISYWEMHTTMLFDVTMQHPN